MNTIAWRAWDGLGGLGKPKLVIRETAVLLILAASLLVFRSLRERCLMVWIVGWIAYFVSHHAMVSALAEASPYALPVAQGEFILAVALFVAGAFIYANARDFLAPLLAISLALIGFATLGSILWAGSVTLRFAFELSFRILTLSAAIQVLRFRRARREIGPWILAAGLLLLHLDWSPVSSRLPAESGLLFDRLLCLPILMLLFDESRLHTRRLVTLNATTSSIARARP